MTLCQTPIQHWALPSSSLNLRHGTSAGLKRVSEDSEEKMTKLTFNSDFKPTVSECYFRKKRARMCVLGRFVNGEKEDKPSSWSRVCLHLYPSPSDRPTVRLCHVVPHLYKWDTFLRGLGRVNALYRLQRKKKKRAGKMYQEARSHFHINILSRWSLMVTLRQWATAFLFGGFFTVGDGILLVL